MADPTDPLPPANTPDAGPPAPADSASPPDADAADAPPLDGVAAAFDSVPDASAGGSTPAIDDAALQELLKLASMETPAHAAGGVDPDAGGGFDASAAAASMESPDMAAAAAGSDAHGFDLPDFHQVIADAAASSIDLLRDVELNVKIELGRSRMLVEDVLKLSEGSVVELDKLAGDPVDVFVNDRLVARGEVLVLNDNFCVRVNEIVAAGREDQG